MNPIICIDPGTKESGFVVLDFDTWPPAINRSGVYENDDLSVSLRLVWMGETTVIEKIESYGMAVGAEVFETVFWTGVFAESVGRANVHRMPRREVKLALCGSPRAKDANIRQAILDIYGGKEAAVGNKKSPGPLYAVKSHAWAALAVGLTYLRQTKDTAKVEAAQLDALRAEMKRDEEPLV